MAEEKQEQYYEDEINLVEVFLVVWRRKLWIAAFVVAALVFSYMWAVSHVESYTQSLVQLNFSGIDKHVYPDKTPFEMHDIISTDILSIAANAIEDAGHRELFLRNPRGFITIDPRIPAEVKEKIKTMERDKLTYNYFPNQFYIRFSQLKDGVFTHEEKKQVLLAINKTYKDKFLKKYVNQNLLPVNITTASIEGYDYGEVVDIFRSYLDTYDAFIENMIKTAGFYKSAQSGLSFVEILSSIENIKKIDLNEIESFLNISLETRKKEMLLQKYQYTIKRLEKDMQKKQEEASAARALLEDVWKQEKSQGTITARSDSQVSTQILLDESVLEKLSAKDYKSVLLQRALDAQIAADSLKIDKSFMEKELAVLNMRNNKQSKTDSKDTFVAEKLEGIRKNIVQLGEKANELASEFLIIQYSDISKTLKYPESIVQYPKNPKMIMIMAFFISLLLGIFMAFVAEYISNAGKKNL